MAKCAVSLPLVSIARIETMKDIFHKAIRVARTHGTSSRENHGFTCSPVRGM